MHEHRPEPDRGAGHEDELARRSHSAEPADVAVHALGHAGAIGSASLFLDRTSAIIEQRAIDKQCPAVQHLDHLARQIAEPPALVGMDREVTIAALQRMVKIDHAAYERGAEDPDAAEIEEIDG